jgi:hypothetical protein
MVFCYDQTLLLVNQGHTRLNRSGDSLKIVSSDLDFRVPSHRGFNLIKIRGCGVNGRLREGVAIYLGIPGGKNCNAIYFYTIAGRGKASFYRLEDETFALSSRATCHNSFRGGTRLHSGR